MRKPPCVCIRAVRDRTIASRTRNACSWYRACAHADNQSNRHTCRRVVRKSQNNVTRRSNSPGRANASNRYPILSVPTGFTGRSGGYSSIICQLGLIRNGSIHPHLMPSDTKHRSKESCLILDGGTLLKDRRDWMRIVVK